MQAKNFTPNENVYLSYRTHRAIIKNPIRAMLKVKNDYDSKKKAILTENKRNGLHLKDSIFIPQYLGFEEKSFFEVGRGRTVFYTKGNFSLMRHPHEDDKWFVMKNQSQNIELSLPNMYIGLTLLQSLGADVSIERYMDGEFEIMK